MFLFCSVPTPPPTDVAPADPAQDRVARHGKVLEELAEIGLDLARALRRQVTEADTPADAGQVAPAFSRIARAVRLALALEDRLAEDHAARVREAEDERAERAAEQERARIKLRHDAAVNRAVVRKMVEETVEAETDEGGRESEPLLAALSEKLDELDEADFVQLPVDAIVMRICKDLGVTYDPALWDDEDEDDDDPASYASQDAWDGPRKPIPVWNPVTCSFQPP
jgi:hypothetical protein